MQTQTQTQHTASRNLSKAQSDGDWVGLKSTYGQARDENHEQQRCRRQHEDHELLGQARGGLDGLDRHLERRRAELR